MRSHIYYLLISITFGLSCNSTVELTTDVLVIGGSVSGTSAAIQAARDGANVILVEPTPWLGGMLTSAGVSATDGNHRLPSGLWGEFRQKLYDHYGGPEAVSTGWVSFTLFEPHIGNEIWQQMADEQPALSRYHGYELNEVMKEGNRVTGAVFVDQKGNLLKVYSTITIEATELGDALEMAGVSYVTGLNTPENPHDDYVQDLTYAAILKDYGEGADKTIEKPQDYQPELYNCICETVCDADTVAMDCDQVLDYAELPGNKFMINWPHSGNDYYVDATKLSDEEREKEYQNAKNITLGLVYFLQTEAGYKHLGLADDEYTTPDLLPYIPYHREARRVNGMVRLTANDIKDPYLDPARPLYRQAIAVGDYPLDHHHKRNPNRIVEDFPRIPSFSIPYGCLVPEETEGLIVAEKSISVSHVVNGASRLQPVVILIGQAAGASAAMCVKLEQQPRDVSIQELQQTLLEANCWLMPFLDIAPQDQYFQAIQRVGVAGWMRGHGVPYQWANQTWFYPDSCVTPEVFMQSLQRATLSSDLAFPSFMTEIPQDQCTSVGAAIRILDQFRKDKASSSVDLQSEIPSAANINNALEVFESNGWLEPFKEKGQLDLDRSILRKELAWLLDAIYLPFESES